MTVAIATILLKHPIFIKCWSCHRNKAPGQQTLFILKESYALKKGSPTHIFEL